MLYIDQLRIPSFPIGLVKTESGFIVRSVETGLERRTLVVTVISLDAYPFLALVGHPSSDRVTIKMPYGVDALHRPASHPIFSYWVG